jgi:hypothetical protein
VTNAVRPANDSAKVDSGAISMDIPQPNDLRWYCNDRSTQARCSLAVLAGAAAELTTLRTPRAA